ALLPPFAGWTGSGGVRVEGTTVHYLVNRAADSFLRPHEPLEGAPVPVVVSPAVARAAGPGGIVALHVGDRTVEGQVVAESRYFPSVDGDFAVADLDTWLTAANTLEPGTTTASEVWLDAPPAAARRLDRPPFSALEVSSQRAAEAQLRGDPLARGALALLLASALVVSVVSVTAGAGAPLPSLELVLDWRLVALALGVTAVVAALAALAATAHAYERVARWRFSEGIE